MAGSIITFADVLAVWQDFGEGVDKSKIPIIKANTKSFIFNMKDEPQKYGRFTLSKTYKALKKAGYKYDYEREWDWGEEISLTLSKIKLGDSSDNALF